jgi:hypothetical protein
VMPPATLEENRFRDANTSNQAVFRRGFAWTRPRRAFCTRPSGQVTTATFAATGSRRWANSNASHMKHGQSLSQGQNSKRLINLVYSINKQFSAISRATRKWSRRQGCASFSQLSFRAFVSGSSRRANEGELALQPCGRRISDHPMAGTTGFARSGLARNRYR